MKSLVSLWIEVICLVAVFYIAAGRIVKVSDVDHVHHELKPLPFEQGVLSKGKHCVCVKYDCGCCIRFTWEEAKLVNTTACVNVSYLPDQYGFALVLTVNHVVLYNKTVSAKNPPPLCFDVPYLEKELSLCIDFYNLEYSKQYINGCVKIQAKIALLKVKTFDLGCFHIPLYSIAAQLTAAEVVESIQLAQFKNELF